MGDDAFSVRLLLWDALFVPAILIILLRMDIMKKILVLCLILAVTFSVTGCGNSEDHIGEAKTPSASSIQKGRDYQSVIKDFEDNGFTNIKLVEQDDLVTGWITKDGEVASVSVDGDENYSADKWYQNDVEVVITYHTFRNSESNIEENTSSEESKNNDKTDTIVQDDSIEEIFTTDNCEEFAAILKLKDDSDPAYITFSEKYKDKIIEFNGCIIYFSNHENYKTRYDILLSAGDYIDENTANPGPVFKFEDVGLYDLGVDYLAGFLATGKNVSVRAKVDEFDADSGTFELDPISITER